MKRLLSILFVLTLVISTTAYPLPTVAGAAETDAAASSEGQEAENQDEEDLEEEEEQKVVVIDAGHQSRAMSETEPNGPGSSTKKAKVTGGTSGCATKIPEYKLTLQMAKKLKKELVKRGYKVYMVRTKNNVKISNVERAKYANKKEADAFIRIHANSSGNSGVKGALTIAPKNNNPYLNKSVRKKSQSLSKKVLKSFCKATGAKNRGVMYTNTMTGINWCKVPVTIVEMGFMSNPSEDRKMATDSYQKKMVKGIADGIDNFLS